MPAARQLYRSRTNRILGGVCGGLAEYFNVDPVIVRILWAAFSLVWGAGILFYFIAWIIIPASPTGTEYPSGPPPQNTIYGGPDDKRYVAIAIGGAIILIGLVALFQSLGWFQSFAPLSFPFGLMVLGALIILIAIMRRR